MSRNKTNIRVIDREFLHADSSSGEAITICKLTVECRLDNVMLSYLDPDDLSKLPSRFNRYCSDILSINSDKNNTMYKVEIIRSTTCNQDDVYDEKLGENIASTKCQVVAFRMMKSIGNYIIKCMDRHCGLAAHNIHTNNKLAACRENEHLKFLLNKVKQNETTRSI